MNMYFPGITELKENKELGSTWVRLRDFISMEAPQRKEIIEALQKEAAANNVASSSTQKVSTNPEEWFDEEAYAKRVTDPENIQVSKKKMNGAIDLLNSTQKVSTNPEEWFDEEAYRKRATDPESIRILLGKFMKQW